MPNYETSDTQDQRSYAEGHSLAEDARALLKATSDAADSTLVEARKRLESALASGKMTYEAIQEQVSEGARMADRCVRENPYKTLAAAVAVGVLLGLVATRRSNHA